MNTLNARFPVLLALCLCSGASMAHEGHGLPGISHWHPTDAMGLIGAAAVVAFGWWLAGRK